MEIGRWLGRGGEGRLASGDGKVMARGCLRGHRYRRKARYYRRRNITQKIAGVTPSSLVNYRELPIIIRTVKVFTIVVGQATGAMIQSLGGPTLSANSLRCNLRFFDSAPFPPPRKGGTLLRFPKHRYETYLIRHFANKSFFSLSR